MSNMKETWRHTWNSRRQVWFIGALTVLVFGVIGLRLLSSSHAGTPTASIETEDGTVSGGCTSKLSDTSASGGQAVKFANCTSSGFVHPGIVLDKTQLDFVKTKLAAQTSPWYDAYHDLTVGATKSFAAASYASSAVTMLQCDGGTDTLEDQCTASMNDARAAYADALLYYYTGTASYATTAKNTLNAWSTAWTPTDSTPYCNDVQVSGSLSINQKEQDATYGVDAAINYLPPAYSTTCVGIVMNGTYNQGTLFAGWIGQTMVQAAEVLRYAPGNGWSSSDIQRFSTMTDKVLLPLVNHGWGVGANWLTTTADATMNIGVFNDDLATFNIGVKGWKRSFPSVIYLSGDNNTCTGMSGYPIAPYENKPCTSSSTKTPSAMNNYWWTPGTYINGLENETCRDMGHTIMGLDGAAYGAETARIQGVNLYSGGNAQRMAAGFELAAKLDSSALANGGSISSLGLGICGGTLNAGGVTTSHVFGWDNGYHALHDIQGISMPQTKSFLDTYKRSSNNDEATFLNWEQLTSASAD